MSMPSAGSGLVNADFFSATWAETKDLGIDTASANTVPTSCPRSKEYPTSDGHYPANEFGLQLNLDPSLHPSFSSSSKIS
jgi:hypothetical protein